MGTRICHRAEKLFQSCLHRDSREWLASVNQIHDGLLRSKLLSLLIKKQQSIQRPRVPRWNLSCSPNPYNSLFCVPWQLLPIRYTILRTVP